jgi:uncharacterized membrane protein
MMKYLQRSGGQVLLLLLSLVGAGIAVYLTSVHYENTPLICSTRGVIDCARVLSSSYSLIPGTTVPITIPGLGWCLISAALALVGWRLASQPRWLSVAQLLWSFVGMLTVLYLVYVEIVRLHTICAWCTALHVLILFMFLITLVRLQQLEEVEAEPEVPDEKTTVTPGRNQR